MKNEKKIKKLIKYKTGNFDRSLPHLERSRSLGTGNEADQNTKRINLCSNHNANIFSIFFYYFILFFSFKFYIRRLNTLSFSLVAIQNSNVMMSFFSNIYTTCCECRKKKNHEFSFKYIKKNNNKAVAVGFFYFFFIWQYKKLLKIIIYIFFSFTSSICFHVR